MILLNLKCQLEKSMENVVLKLGNMAVAFRRQVKGKNWAPTLRTPRSAVWRLGRHEVTHLPSPVLGFISLFKSSTERR